MRVVRGSDLVAVLFILAVVALVVTTVSSRQNLEFGVRSSADEVGLLEAPISMSAPTAILLEDGPLPGAPLGETVDSLSSPVVNHVGGYGITVNSAGSGTTLSNVWGNAGGGPGGIIITEGTYGDLEQSSFESFHGLSDAGIPSYSASSVNLVTGETGLDGAWLGPSVVLNELDPVVALPGQFSTFNSRPGITALGQPYWIGGITDSQGGSTQNRVLFFGVGASPVLMGGDPVIGVPEPITATSSNLDFDYRFSQFGTNYLTPVNLDAPSTEDGLIVSNGAAVLVGGMIVREASPVPAIAGGLLDENWDNFDFMGINEEGLVFFTGDTDADTAMDEFVLQGETIILREGAILTTLEGMFTISGAIEGGYQNEQGDWAVIWDVDDALGENIEVLIFNGEPVLKEGDEVDFDGDGIPDIGATLANFTGISTLVVGDRQEDGIALVCFTADVDTEGTSSSSDDTEIFYCMEFQFEVPDPDDEDEDSDEDTDEDSDEDTDIIGIGVGDDWFVQSETIGSGGSVEFRTASASSMPIYKKTSTQGETTQTRRSAGRGLASARATDRKDDDLLKRISLARQKVLRLGLEGGGSELRRHVEALLDEAEATGQDETIEMAENVLRLLYDRVER